MYSNEASFGISSNIFFNESILINLRIFVMYSIEASTYGLCIRESGSKFNTELVTICQLSSIIFLMKNTL